MALPRLQLVSQPVYRRLVHGRHGHALGMTQLPQAMPWGLLPQPVWLGSARGLCLPGALVLLAAGVPVSVLLLL